MKPRKLIICGWGPYKAEEKIDFNALDEKGIFLITGPTGAGKTTVFDAITYALYGALSGDERDKERNSVRSDFADANMPTYVELEMEHGGKWYRIYRNPEYLRPRKRNKSGNGYTREKENAILYYEDGRILEGVREVNTVIKELLVLDYRQFKKISMIAQGEFARLLVASPKEKTQIFREIFDTGIYERFTQELGARARAVYHEIKEQKNKLEEDIRLFLMDYEKVEWEPDRKELFEEAVSEENKNYSNIKDQLWGMMNRASEEVERHKLRYKRADKRAEGLSAEIALVEEQNRKLIQFENAEKSRQKLEELTPEYERMNQRYERAMNAGWVESSDDKVRLAEENVRRAEKEITILLTQQIPEAEERLHKKQQEYLESERECMQAREACEEAERKRRLDAVGIVAELLEAGKPCPVCGSVEHPAPAMGNKRETISEAGRKVLQRAAEDAEKKRLGLHAETVQEKAKRDVLQEKLQEAREQKTKLEKTVEVNRKAFAEILLQYGFHNRKEYEEAKLTREERTQLQRRLEEFRAKKAATEELYQHLKNSISSYEPVDLTQKRTQLADAWEEKKTGLQEQKKWESVRDSARRTWKFLDEKLTWIEEESKEYGYVKDLENLACGNNPGKLVFEQYVLAGCFEEILRAANLRFAKMTGGRYEMSRDPQVGDGRVKDNLEIRVMDYYTGKYRSVRTLSGGESFKASLSLALGMSDVIQAMNGGIRVDTLFVDEGFGALDEESLEQACETLMGLVEKNHMIGIISHVPQLRERIEQQLVIEKTGTGSRIRMKL